MTTAGGVATRSSLAAPRWADLTSDLLRDISSRLHDAADFARFHAVCEPWRNSLPSPTTTTFFPCLVAPHDDFSGLKLIRCPFSNASYRAPAPVRFGKRGWVARTDGTAAWFFPDLPEPRLVDPLTGSAAPMPFFVDNGGAMEKYSRGSIYDDGTTFLHYFTLGRTLVFKAAILSPGDTAWRFVECTVNYWSPIKHYLAAYHEGKILLYMEIDTYHTYHSLALLDTDTGASVVERVERNEAWSMPDGEVITYWHESTHILESRGELLRVSVLARRDGNLKGQGAAGHARALAVSVHALEGVEEADTADGSVTQVMKWTSRDGRSLADRVLFLGFPTSFSVDAARFHGAEDDVIGGCAYFFHSWSVGHGPAKSPCRLFRYSLVDRKAKYMEHLPPEWSGLKERCVWLLPQPEIAPLEVHFSSTTICISLLRVLRLWRGKLASGKSKTCTTNVSKLL
jgi:hypothetical protein